MIVLDDADLKTAVGLRYQRSAFLLDWPALPRLHRV